jgi:hypothetical protein
MDINDIFGQGESVAEEVYKSPAISPFDFINSINYDKTNLIVDDWSEKQYVPYIVNKGLSYSSDTVIQANEVNSRAHIDKKLQYDFLINSIRPKKRYNKWIKAEKVEDLELVKAYYGYSTEKARQALSILNKDHIQIIKTRMNKGGP